VPQFAISDWWDDFASGVHEKITAGADFIRDKAAPVIREKFNGAKESLQDPETHEKVQSWVKEKFHQFKTFVNEEVAPEVQKIVEAAKKASQNSSTKDESRVREDD